MNKNVESLEQEEFIIVRAVRHATPQVVAVWGPTFSGKTFGAFMIASGLADPGMKVGFIDTENGRGSMYADDLDVIKALPQGYDVIELSAPFHPHRYVSAIAAFEKAGYGLLIIDSGSHAWNGTGGCSDITERNKGRWNKAKLANRRFLNAILHSSMHVIVCLRAQAKTKIVPKEKSGTGKEEVVELGIQPICEKEFPFDLGLCFSIEANTHLATPVKWPKAMDWLCNKWQPQMLTKDVGARLREWNNSGSAEPPLVRLFKKARAAADEGSKRYEEFYNGLNAAAKKAVFDGPHSENTRIAAEVDRDQAALGPEENDGVAVFGSFENPVEWPDQFAGEELMFNGQHLRLDHESGNFKVVGER